MGRVLDTFARAFASASVWVAAGVSAGVSAGPAPAFGQSPSVETADPASAVTLTPPVLSDEEAVREAARIASALRSEVPAAIVTTRRRRLRMVSLARAALDEAGRTITRPQLLVVVDRNPSVQLMLLLVAMPDAPWVVLGGTRVSTGQRGRKLYYITPTGVFANSDTILGYRAQGTFNEHHIRGNGLKGMRVWDFGWHDAVKGWTPDHEIGAIRLEVHATDPDVLERRLGRPASEGCIRVPASMNRFLDLHGILDLDDERAAVLDLRFRALLLPDRHPTPLAGDLLIVVDSAVAADADPGRAGQGPA